MNTTNSHQPMPEGACAAFAATIPLLDDPALEPTRAAAARDHLRGCATCRALRAEYADLDRGLRRHFGLASIPPRPTEEIMRFITDRSQPATPTPSATPRPLSTAIGAVRRRVLPNLAAVASILVVIGISALLVGTRLGFGPGAHLGPPRYSFPGTTGSLAGISMVSPDEGWALGQVLKDRTGDHPLTEVTFYHLKDGVWTAVIVPTTVDLSEGGVSGFNGTISMDSPTDGWAVAHNFNRISVLFHYTGGAWQQVAGPDIWSLQALGPTDVWAIAGLQDGRTVGLQHFDGTAWTLQALPVSPAPDGSSQAVALHMLSEHEGWALISNDLNGGVQGYTVAHYADGVWKAHSTLNAGEFASFYDLAMVSPEDGWAIGEKIAADSHGETTHVPLKPLLYHYANGRWSESPLTLNGLPFIQLRQLLMVSATEGWVVGTEQATYFGSTTNNFQQHTVLLHYAGGKWAQVETPPVGTPVDAITGLSFTTDGNGWASGYNSNIPASQRVQDSDVLAQASPMLWRYQNGGWTLYEQP
jgi:hypothetical protein